MTEQKHLADLFEQNRSHLRAVAFRMLGSVTEAEDAVQETWLKLSRSDTTGVENLPGWLTKVVARACLDMLRKRKSRPEDPAGTHFDDEREAAGDPGTQAELADSIGLAMLVVLETLAPSERIAFVLHDMFAVPFDEIASLVGKSPEATRKLASRARRRVQGAPEPLSPDVERRRKVVEAFLAAARAGDFDALVGLLDPNVVLHADESARARGFLEARGSHEIASRAAKAGARAAQAAVIDGDVGLIIAPFGRLMVVVRYTIEDDRIVAMEAIGDPQRLATFDLSMLHDSTSELLRRLATGSPLECVEAAKQLARRNDRAVLPEVASILLRGESEHARTMAAWLLGELSPGTDVTLDALHSTIDEPNASESLRGQAIESLGNQVCHLKKGEVYERAADTLITLLQHPSVEILYNAIFALGTMRCRRARSKLARIAEEDHRGYSEVQTVSQCAQFAIQCIDQEPHARNE